MDNSNKVLSDADVSVDRQSMLDAVYEKIAYKEETNWCIYRFNKDYFFRNWSGVNKWHLAILIKRDMKYEHTFLIPWFRDAPLLPHKIFLDLDKIWHPISLERVLSELGIDYFYNRWCIYYIETYIDYAEEICERKLLTDSWSDAFLDDQSDDTIRVILTLISEK